LSTCFSETPKVNALSLRLVLTGRFETHHTGCTSGQFVLQVIQRKVAENGAVQQVAHQLLFTRIGKILCGQFCLNTLNIGF
jgi:hypothetical protein